MLDISLTLRLWKEQHLKLLRGLSNHSKCVLERLAKEFEFHGHTSHCQCISKEQQLPRNLGVPVLDHIKFTNGVHLLGLLIRNYAAGTFSLTNCSLDFSTGGK